MNAALQAPSGATPITAGGSPVNPAQALSTRLLRTSLHAIASAIGKDETAACRIRANERPCTLSEFCKLIDVAGMKLVSKDKHCVPADELRMLRRAYAEKHELIWNDPE